MPGISPRPSSITYHPYTHSPSALTEYLRWKLRQQWAKRLSCSHSTQVEQDVPIKHNTLGLEQEMLNDRSNWGIADECGEALRSEQERIKCQSTEDMAHGCGEALPWEQEMLNYWSTWIIEDRCREALGSEQETIKCQSTYGLTHACGEALRLE